MIKLTLLSLLVIGIFSCSKSDVMYRYEVDCGPDGSIDKVYEIREDVEIGSSMAMTVCDGDYSAEMIKLY